MKSYAHIDTKGQRISLIHSLMEPRILKKKNDRTINCIFLRTFEEPIKFQKMDDNKCPYLQERKTTIELIIIKSVDDTKLGRIALEENKKVRKALDRLDH